MNNNKFLLVHAGISDYNPNKSIENYSPEDLIWYGAELSDSHYQNEYKSIIVGHTPTIVLSNKRPTSIIFGSGNYTFIDCGAVFEEDGGRLSCLCLDTMEEYYV